MSKICIATDAWSGMHEFLPGSERDRRRLNADLWEVCGEKRGHHRHKDACDNGCGRTAAKGSTGGYCCKRCVQDDTHSGKCDEREARDE